MFTLGREATYTEEIKKSRFIVRAAPAADVHAAFAFLERVREARATHNCWAYRIGEQYRFSDDGEPAGTAGKPILGAIAQQAVDGVMVVVIRYYGGIKLGAGGLARAYGGCTAKCLNGATLVPVVQTAIVDLNVGFEDIGVVYPVIDRFEAEKLSERYTENGLAIRLRIRRSDAGEMQSVLTEASAGRIQLSASNDGGAAPPPIR